MSLIDFLDQPQIMDGEELDHGLFDRRDKRTQVEQKARPGVDARCVAKVFYKQSEDEVDGHLVVSLDEEKQNKVDRRLYRNATRNGD